MSLIRIEGVSQVSLLHLRPLSIFISGGFLEVTLLFLRLMISLLIIIIIIIWDLLLCLFQLLTKLLPFILFQLGLDINELVIIIIWDTFLSLFIKLWVLWLIIDNAPRIISLNLGDNSLSRFIHVVIIILAVSGRSVLDLEITVLYSLFLTIKARLSGLLVWEISLWWLRSVSL